MAAKSILPAVWDVPDQFRKRLGEKAGRQRTMFADGHLLLVLHQPPRPDETERVGRYFWRKGDGTWSSSDLGGGPGALKKHLTEYAELVERYDRDEEAAVSAEEYFAILNNLAPLHRAARNLHSVLQEARKLCPDDRDIINLRDQAYEIERTAELLYNDAKNALDYAVAKRAEEQAHASHQMAISAHRLNLLVAFFFPLATLSAVFGMNLLHGLETLRAPIPLITIVALGLMFGAILAAFVTTNTAARQSPKSPRYTPGSRQQLD